jgi:hypothetical protein
MRHAKWARGGSFALALSICVPAFADHAKKSVSECTAFDESEKGEDALQLTVHNSCSMPVDCTLSWVVVCAPKSAKRRAEHASSASFSLDHASSQSADASAAVCGDDSWSIEGVSWTCQPKDE